MKQITGVDKGYVKVYHARNSFLKNRLWEYEGRNQNGGVTPQRAKSSKD